MSKSVKKEEKKKKRYYEKDNEEDENLDLEGLNPETKKGILAIFLVAIAVVSLLSLFNLAGRAGIWLDNILSLVFGGTKWIFPVVLALVSYFVISSRMLVVNILSYIGAGVFLLSVSSLINVISLTEENILVSEELIKAGGYLGLVFAWPFLKLMGFYASLVMIGAILLISLLILFNISLHQLGRTSFFWAGWLKSVLNLRNLFKKDEVNEFENTEQNEEEFSEDDDFDEEEDFDQTSSKLGFIKKVVSDQVSEVKAEGIIIKKEKPKKRKKVDLPFDLLDIRVSRPNSGDISANSEKIRKALENFGIDVEMGEINIGPTVTQYTLKPAEGIKLSRITGLNNDLALSLAAHPIRIEAPIPGKSLVGVEVPNKSAAIVTIKELLSSKEFKVRSSNLSITLGKDVSGKTWLANVAKMPHLLIAGATGSGKTVCINSIIVSLLYQNSPDEIKFVLIDPKKVELAIYNRIPHLLTPVITDVKKTINALKWAILEMDRRFELLSKFNSRDIHSYNEKVSDKLPFIVIIIDELADLMATAANDVEALIIRLAQMARAVGIHLILATQRPSVDVITGLIKANITTRIAFSVASVVDSRTILDTSGAEKLLGRGDMLFMSADISKPKRLQGAWVSEPEVKRVADYLVSNYERPDFDESVVESHSSTSGIIFGSSNSGDELYDDAKRIIIQAGKGSASFLQRRLKVGYARAARLMDLLEENGVVGPADGAKPREVLMTKDDFSSDSLSLKDEKQNFSTVENNEEIESSDLEEDIDEEDDDEYNEEEKNNKEENEEEFK